MENSKCVLIFWFLNVVKSKRVLDTSLSQRLLKKSKTKGGAPYSPATRTNNIRMSPFWLIAHIGVNMEKLIHLPISVCLSVSVCLSLCLSLSFPLSLSFSVSLSLSLSVSVSLSLSLSLSICTLQSVLTKKTGHYPP